MSENKLMEKALAIAVPMWVVDLQHLPIDKLLPRTAGFSSYIGAHGDTLLFGGGKKGVAAECFNKVAEGLAILSMVCPGGVQFGDQHFEYPHKDLKNEMGPN